MVANRQQTVSVVIPAFNSVGTIRRAVDSVLAQSFPPAQIIVVDDGSTDGTAAAVRAYGASVRLIRQDNSGPAAARNVGAAEVESQLLAFLDADDYWYPRKLERQMHVFSWRPEVAICQTCFFGFDSSLAPPPIAPVGSGRIELVRDFRKVLRNPYLATPTVMMRTEVFRQCGGFNPAFRSAEDVDLWLRVSYGRVLARLDEFLVGIGHHAASLTARTGHSLWHDNLRVLEEFAAGHPEFSRRHPQAIRSAKARVLTGLGSSLLSESRPAEASSVLRQAMRYRFWGTRTAYLLGKSFLKNR